MAWRTAGSWWWMPPPISRFRGKATACGCIPPRATCMSTGETTRRNSCSNTERQWPADARQRVRHGGQGVHRLCGIVVVSVHVRFHHLVQIEGVHHSGCCRAQGVADELADVFVAHDGRGGGQNLALRRLLDVALNGGQPVLAGMVAQVVQHLQRLQVTLLAVRGTLKDPADALCYLLQNMKRIGDQSRSHGRPADDEQFGRLKQDQNIPFFKKVTSENCCDNYQNSDYREHRIPR